MSIETFDLTKRLGAKRLQQFAAHLQDISHRIGFKISSRGWCYALEVERIINKDQFNKVEAAINRCRRKGLIPIDFVAEDDARMFSGVETPNEKDPDGKTMAETVQWMLRDALNGGSYYTPDWWEDEDYYIQVVVEKIDLKTLFEPVCQDYKIPIATSKGWASMLQRAQYARRYAEAEADGKECVLLYCGDHDPDGLRISEFMRKNLYDLRQIKWDDGQPGYDPTNLVIDRFGLNFDYIKKHGFTWIDNLITGSGKNLASPNHKNFKMPYVQEYLGDVGERKCEANAIITQPKAARDLLRKAIEKYLGDDAPNRFYNKREDCNQEYRDMLDSSGVSVKGIEKAIKKLNKL